MSKGLTVVEWLISELKIMNHKEKAEELIDRFIQETRNRFESKSMSYRRAKQCALICVDEIIDSHGNSCSECHEKQDRKLNELIQVKQEIEKL